MKLSQIIKSKFKDQRGAVAVIVAVSMVALIGFVALAIDFGYLYATKNELQNVADAAALAGAGKLGEIYSDPDNNIDPSTYDCGAEHQEAIRLAAQGVVGTGKNSAGGQDITIRDQDIFINNLEGVEDTFPKYRFNINDYDQPDAVRVIAQRGSDGTSDGTPFRIGMFFARIFKIDSLPVTADATAALTAQSIAGPGGLPLPIAINKTWMDTIPCNQNLTLYPSSGVTCAGWHSYTEDSGYRPNANPNFGFRGLLDDLADFTYESPETIAGVTQFDFSNGTVSSIFTHGNFENLFDVMKIKDDGFYDMDEDPTTWTLSVPIFDDSTLSGCNPAGLLTIVGFAAITITGVDGPPDHTVYANIVCEKVRPGRGGGAEYGTKGSIPGLIE